jgi:hypothetical protein
LPDRFGRRRIGRRDRAAPAGVRRDGRHRMRWEGERESSNVEDRRGARGGGFGGLPVGGRGIGLGGIVVAFVAAWLFGINPMTVLQLMGGGSGPRRRWRCPAPAGRPHGPRIRRPASCRSCWPAPRTCSDRCSARPAPSTARPSSCCSRAARRALAAPATRLPDRSTVPATSGLYIDLSFFRVMRERMGAPGDFAQAYVVAHEVGHHVQNLLGTMREVHSMRGRLSQAQNNALSVRLELQADCLAGVWAARSQQARGWLETGDLDEALRAAAAVATTRCSVAARARWSPRPSPTAPRRSVPAGSAPASRAGACRTATPSARRALSRGACRALSRGASRARPAVPPGGSAIAGSSFVPRIRATDPCGRPMRSTRAADARVGRARPHSEPCPSSASAPHRDEPVFRIRPHRRRAARRAMRPAGAGSAARVVGLRGAVSRGSPRLGAGRARRRRGARLLDPAAFDAALATAARRDAAGGGPRTGPRRRRRRATGLARRGRGPGAPVAALAPRVARLDDAQAARLDAARARRRRAPWPLAGHRARRPGRRAGRQRAARAPTRPGGRRSAGRAGRRSRLDRHDRAPAPRLEALARATAGAPVQGAPAALGVPGDPLASARRVEVESDP